MTATKPFTIPKRLVYDAWKAVKANAGSAGVDKETIDGFKEILSGKFDNDEEYPEQAFYLVGNIEEMKAKAVSLTKKSAKK